MAVTPSMIPAPDDVIAGKYRVESQLGEGGMAVVLAARHEALRQRVAIKIVQPQYVGSNELKERFFREARALAALTSPHVARIFDVGTLDNGATYLVLEYLEGLDLHRLVQRDGPLSPRDAALYLREAALGLAEAHKLGILHRDLKPSNLFLAALPTGAPCIKILDFGLAKLTEEGITGLTEREDVMGSPSYMAPEQIRGLAQADHRSDVWSLGVTLYELLTDALPFEGANATKTAAAVLTEKPFDLTKRRAGLPDELVRIVADCLVKDPDKRLGSAQLLADRLKAFAAMPAPMPDRGVLAGIAEPVRKAAPSGRGSGKGKGGRDAGGEATYGGMMPLTPLDNSEDATLVVPRPASRDGSRERSREGSREGSERAPGLASHPLDERTVEEATLVKLQPIGHDDGSDDQTVMRPREGSPPHGQVPPQVPSQSLPQPLPERPPNPSQITSRMSATPSASSPSGHGAMTHAPVMPRELDHRAAPKIDWKVPIAVGLAVAIGVILIGLVAIRLV